VTEARPRTFWDVPDELVDADWAAKREAATVVRELVATLVTTDAPAAALDAAKAHARAALAAIADYPKRTFGDIIGSGSKRDVAKVADRATLVGPCNPVAPPMTLKMLDDDSRAVGEVTFDSPYEGGPGMLHGGLVAAAFDQVFGYLQTVRRVPCLTGTLNTKYRLPTPIQTPLVFEVWVTSVSGRRTKLEGKCTARGQVTAEADALFIEIDGDMLKKRQDD
jgi:hypothetical protein